jgi:hypothetical protein
MRFVLASFSGLATVMVGVRYARCRGPRYEMTRWLRNQAAVSRLGGNEPAIAAPAPVWCRVVSTAATIPKPRQHDDFPALQRSPSDAPS